MTDPVPAAASETERDLRPVVAAPPRNLSLVAIGLVVAAVAVALFLFLDGPRRTARLPSAAEATDTARLIQPPPPLAVPPPAPIPATPEPAVEPPLEVTVAPSGPPPPAYTPTTPAYQPPPPYPQPTYQPPAPERPRGAGQSDQALVVDTTVSDAGAPAASNDANAPAAGIGAVLAQRSRATRLRQRDTTVAQGTLIPAVLESALDSSQAGLARAFVSRDVRGFDGSRVLIPRGSRLIGEYRSDLAPGQRRVLLTWTRLIRPDGASIVIASPASDPLGRVGVAGAVNTHFFERFGSAILRSVLDIGVNVATSRIGGAPIIVGIPGGVGGNVGQAIGSPPVAPPTITVRQGTAVSVFVARDLDFSSVEGRR